MKKRYSTTFLPLGFIICLLLGFSILSQAQEEPGKPLTLEARLKNIMQTIESKEAAIKLAKRKIRKESEEATIEQIKQQIASDEDIIKGMRAQFISLSAGGEKIFSERKKIEEGINWKEDLEAIFSPIVDQLKEISARPKVIEELEQDIAYWEYRMGELNRAVNYLTTTQNSISDKKITKEIKELTSIASSRYESAGQKLSILKAELEDIKSDENPFWDNIFSLLKSFATSMLYYLVIAIFLAFIAFQIVVLIAKIPKLLIDKKQPKRYVFAERTINLIKNVIGFTFSIAVYLVVLYSSGQWVLLVVSIFIVMGIGLTLRNLIPTYLVEIRTLLNFGSIRQGERIKFNGIIWKINLIDIYTHIHNPALDAHLRVPIGNLVDLSSRPIHKDEPWFPCKAGDVVLLNDGVFGTVRHQSIDVVEIDFGSSIYNYPTEKFLESCPRNLSRGFTVHEIFGFDYKHQQDIIDAMQKIYSDGVEKAIKASSVGQYCTDFNIEFDKAASSSLDFKVLAQFSGEAASSYFKISRIIQQASVEIANQNHWIIPFPQISVHQNN